MTRVRPSLQGIVRTLTAAALAVTGLAVLPTAPATADGTPDYLARVNMQRQVGAAPPTGYIRDWGQAYDSARGYGWVTADTTTPLDMTSWSRIRNINLTDRRLDTLVHMQPSSTINASWEYAVPNGAYRVTVAAGDPAFFNSVHRVVVEGVVAIDNFVPTAAVPNATATVDVTVTDGRITVAPTGGKNTKLNYVDVINLNPRFLSTSPFNGQGGVSTTTSIILSPNTNIDPATVDSTTFQVLGPNGVQVAGSYNSDAAGGVATFTPAAALSPNTLYTFRTTAGLTDKNGVPFQTLNATFTTGIGGLTQAPVSFTRTTFANTEAITSLAFGPDGKLYWSTAVGQLFRAALNPDGSRNGAVEDLGGWPYQTLITGIAFDPASTAANPILWVSRGYLAFDDVPNYTGKLSVLTGANLENKRDVVVGIPRSVHDHMNNGIKFGPDGRLYMLVGANQGYGAADNYWGERPETPLSAAMLVMDTRTAPFQGTIDVTTAPDGTYDPFAAGAPVKVYAEGIRNAYDMLWHSNGALYAPVNESAGGNTPAGPNNVPPALFGLGAGSDFLARIEPGKYYGHPNPSRGYYVLNGGNPTTNADYFETPQYPVGTQPHANWSRPLVDLGEHRSPNGISEYKSSVLGQAFKGMILLTEYSAGDDLLGLFPDANGNIAGLAQVATGFNNPIQVVSSASNGVIYVAEYGTQPNGTGGQLTMLTPVVQAAPGSLALSTQDEVLGVGLRLSVQHVVGSPVQPRPVTLKNTGTGNLTITGFSFGGTDAANFTVAAGEATSFVLAPGASRNVNITFTGPATWSRWQYDATLSVLSNDPGAARVIQLSGLSIPGYEGANEVNLRQLFKTLGLGTVVNQSTTSKTVSKSVLPNGDEIISPYFTRVDATKPVTVTSLAHIESRELTSAGGTGWFVKPALSTTTISRKQIFYYTGGDPATGGGENQKIWPVVTGTTSFTPTSSVFGFYNGFSQTSGDRLNGCPADPHKVRVYPVEQPDGTPVPGKLILATDISCSGGNHDFQDFVVLLNNVVPEVATSATPYPYTNAFAAAVAGTVLDAGGAGTGFTDVLPNTAGNQLDASKLLLSTGGTGTLGITSTVGTFAGATNTQANALRRTADISAKTSFVVGATLAAPQLSLVQDGHAAGVWFGPDQDNLVNLQVQRSGGVLQVAAFREELGVRTAVGTPVALTTVAPDLAAIQSVQLVLTGATAAGTLTPSFTVTTAAGTSAPVALAAATAPADRQYWFSRSAGAGLFATQASGTPAFTASFDAFRIAAS